MRRTAAALTLAIATVPWGAAGQQVVVPPLPPVPRPIQLPQIPPVFRARVDLVQVDVSVLDETRRPVRGLKPSDFTLLEDGKSQEIVAFSEMAASDPDAPADSWMRTVVPDVKVNNAEDGRLLLLILDDGRTPPFPLTRDGKPMGPDPKTAVIDVARAIVERMGPADLAAVIFTINNKHEQEFTSDRDRLFAAIDGFKPLPGGDAAETFNGMRAMSTYKDAAKFLGSIPQRRKAIVLISPFAPRVKALEVNAGERAGGLLQEALEWAYRGNVTFYNINPLVMTGLDAEVDRLLGPETDDGSGAPSFAPPTSGLPVLPRYYDANNPPQTPLDRATGGFSITRPSEFAEGVTQIFRESGSYYLLGYASPNLKDDGKIRRIDVRVNRENLAVRSRAGFVPPKPTPELRNASPLWTAIAGLTPAKDIPMRATIAPFAIPGKKEVALAIVLGLRQPKPAEMTADKPVSERVTFLTRAFTTNGDARGQPQFQSVELTLRPGPSTDVKYEVLSRLDLKPGRYHLRLSATSRLLGKSGSIYYDVEVPDFTKAPLSLSGVVLSTSPPLPSGPTDALTKILPVVPTTQREFRGHEGSAFMRLYQGGKAPLSDVRMSTRIRDQAGAAAAEILDTIAAARFDGKTRAAEYRFDLPIDRLAPGPYVMTITATSATGSATQDVRIVVSR